MKTANKIIMIIAGLVLIVASALKAHQLLTEPIISPGFWESWLFFVFQIPLELGLGIWLLCGLFRKAGWLIAVFSFGIFIMVTLYKGLIGAESCGCFGVVHVKPWVTLFAVDMPLFIGLLVFYPRDCRLLPPPWPAAGHFFGVAIPTFILLGIIVPILVFNKPPDKTDGYEVIRPEAWPVQKPVIKEPEPIVKPANQQPIQTGQEEKQPEASAEQWPLLEHIDIADSLRSGIAVVLLYHQDCPDCLEAIPLYNRMCRDLVGNEDAIKIAFIEIPPYGPQDQSPIPADTLCLTGRLDSKKKLYMKITTPLVVVLLDGSVVKFWEVEVPGLDEILEAVFVGG